jgi:hypothetical protein
VRRSYAQLRTYAVFAAILDSETSPAGVMVEASEREALRSE